jgi:flagellar export protein FliJ
VSQFASQIRLHKWHTDEARRELADLERLEAGLRADLAGLEAEVAREAALSLALEAQVTIGAYAAAVVLRREKLGRSIAEVVERVAEARERLRDAFAELKKFELAAEAAAARLRRAAERREQVALDEVALNQFRRKPRSS